MQFILIKITWNLIFVKQIHSQIPETVEKLRKNLIKESETICTLMSSIQQNSHTFQVIFYRDAKYLNYDHCNANPFTNVNIVFNEITKAIKFSSWVKWKILSRDDSTTNNICTKKKANKLCKS